MFYFSTKGYNGRRSPEELIGLNKTISRLFDQLDIDKPKHGHNFTSQKEASKSPSKTSKSQIKSVQVQKSSSSDDVRDVKSILAKLKVFENEFQKRKSTQEDTFKK